MNHISRQWMIVTAIMITTVGALIARSETPEPAKRPLWTTSRVAGSPEPPERYRVERVHEDVKLDRPVDASIWPLAKRWVVASESGVLQSFADETGGSPAPLLDIRRPDHDKLAWNEQRRLWSFTFHPDFAHNGYLYVCFHDPVPAPKRTRLVRYTYVHRDGESAPTIDPATAYPIADWNPGDDHFGGCLKFGTDGMLYISVGDGSGYGDEHGSGQDVTDFNASILRIDVDHADADKHYAVPRDNPMLAVPGAKPELFAYGLRNIWRMSVDSATGDLWGGDVGQDLWESVFHIEPGHNYGWSLKEGSHDFRPDRPAGPTPISPPVFELDHSEARSIIGGEVYHGRAFPELDGTYIYGDFDTGKIWALTYDRDKHVMLKNEELIDTPLRIVSFAHDHDGELLIIDYAGGLYRIERARPQDAPAHPFPRRLSETGLFASTADLTPAPGTVPYEVNAPLWSDGAIKQRFIAVPGDAKIEFSPVKPWKFPEGTVLVKTFMLELRPGDPTSRRRLETRLLHLEQNHWRGYTYLWNDAQTDAELIGPAALERTYEVADAGAPGGVRKQTWHFPSRAECTLCHTMPAGFTLGVNTAQLNRPHDYDGTRLNQLAAFEQMGLFTRPISETLTKLDAAGHLTSIDLPHLTDPSDASQPLADRARSYMQANCAHCHMRMGGGNSQFELLSSIPLADMHIVSAPPVHSDMGLTGGVILAPGDADHSMIPYRMSLLGKGRMPPAGTNVVDAAGVALLRQWIGEMK
ncbi:MAG: hypothetical protein GC162_06915 [Planctomycetes bacterium]|nr:hypothetical protein [Planctomycetota bacterium]